MQDATVLCSHEKHRATSRASCLCFMGNTIVFLNALKVECAYCVGMDASNVLDFYRIQANYCTTHKAKTTRRAQCFVREWGNYLSMLRSSCGNMFSICL